MVPTSMQRRGSGFDAYLNSCDPSPWRVVEGWHFKSVFHDPMHVIYLGTLRDLYSSAMGFWIRRGFWGEGTLEEKLLQLSRLLKASCRQEGWLGVRYHLP